MKYRMFHTQVLHTAKTASSLSSATPISSADFIATGKYRVIILFLLIVSIFKGETRWWQGVVQDA